MKYACGVVLYYPTEHNVDRIKLLAVEFDKCLVFDNSPRSSGIFVGDSVYFSTGENEGLAVPYNRFISYCTEKDIDFLCILDQDSLLSADEIKQIKGYVENHYDDNVIIYAPHLKGSKEKRWVINSNSFLNIAAVRRFSLSYDENYFIDRLDVDFCRVAMKHGLKVRIIDEITVEHHIGDGRRHEHSPARHYYILKSRLYYNRKFYSAGGAIIRDIFQTIRHFFIILFEKDIVDKWKACLEAAKDYARGRLGRHEGSFHM